MEIIYTRFEKARIIGARALQLAYGAPPLIKVPEEMINPLDLAQLEFEKNIIPITILKEGQA
jgi:DNA-directed RNA polymerase subunit K